MHIKELRMNYKNFLFLITMFYSLGIIGQEKTDPNRQDQELGEVSWFRDYNEAIQQAESSDKDVLILFQEVPGCSTCRNYGQNVLSHPLMVEAIENLFVPLVIHNNKNGKDKEILKKFGEPSWNNPVVRIVDVQGKNVVDRLAADYSSEGLIAAMESALASKNKELPEYVHLLKQEINADKKKDVGEKFYKMYCFWSGEQHLGAADGVISTEPGFIGGAEVVKVAYDKNIVSADKLDGYAKSASCEPIESNKNYRFSKKDNKYNLKYTDYKYLPLTIAQSTKINSALAGKSNPESFLSPVQKKYLEKVKASKDGKKVLFDISFEEAWKVMATEM